MIAFEFEFHVCPKNNKSNRQYYFLARGTRLRDGELSDRCDACQEHFGGSKGTEGSGADDVRKQHDHGYQGHVRSLQGAEVIRETRVAQLPLQQ